MIDLEFIRDLRKKAYVDAISSMAAFDNVLGYFGNLYDEPFIYAHSLAPVPIVGTDSAIFSYGDKMNTCDAVRSTLIYRDTEKCPLIFSSKAFLIEDFCEAFTRNFTEGNEKEIYTYKKTYDHEDLGSFIGQVCGKDFDQVLYEKACNLLEEIDQIKADLLRSDISNKKFNYANYYSRYIIDLNERLDFFKSLLDEHEFSDKKRVYKAGVCPYGILYGIDDYILKEEDEDLFYGPYRCELEPEEYIKYLN